MTTTWLKRQSRFLIAGAAAAVAQGTAMAAEPITVLINSSPWYGGFEAIVEKYEAETGNTVNIDRTPYDGVLEKARNAVRGGESPYDLLNIDNSWIVEFYTGGFLTPLQEIDPDFELGADIINPNDSLYWNAEKEWPTSDGGTLMTISPNANLHLWYYRSDLIDVPPETWDDVFAICSELHNPPDLYGAVQRGERGNPIRYAFTPHMLGFGGSIVRNPVEGDFTVTVNSQENLQALENFLRLLGDCSTANPGSVGQGEMIQLVASGTAAQAGIVIAAQAQMDDPERSIVIGKIDYTIMPRPSDGRHGQVYGSWQLGIPENISDERKQAAMEFIRYFLTEDAQTAYAEGGGIPVHNAVLRGPLSQEHRYRWMQPYADAAEEAVQVLMYREGAQVDSALGLRLNQAVIGELTAVEALNAAAEDIHTIFERSGRSTGKLPPLE